MCVGVEDHVKKKTGRSVTLRRRTPKSPSSRRTVKVKPGRVEPELPRFLLEVMERYRHDMTRTDRPGDSTTNYPTAITDSSWSELWPPSADIEDPIQVFGAICGCMEIGGPLSTYTRESAVLVPYRLLMALRIQLVDIAMTKSNRYPRGPRSRYWEAYRLDAENYCILTRVRELQAKGMKNYMSIYMRELEQGGRKKVDRRVIQQRLARIRKQLKFVPGMLQRIQNFQKLVKEAEVLYPTVPDCE